LLDFALKLKMPPASTPERLAVVGIAATVAITRTSHRSDRQNGGADEGVKLESSGHHLNFLYSQFSRAKSAEYSAFRV
jgi:hypothetical protein